MGRKQQQQLLSSGWAPDFWPCSTTTTVVLVLYEVLYEALYEVVYEVLYQYEVMYGVLYEVLYEVLGNETGKVAIAHGSVEFCEATPIGLADES